MCPKTATDSVANSWQMFSARKTNNFGRTHSLLSKADIFISVADPDPQGSASFNQIRILGYKIGI
jgi:hypothetical protein